VRESTHFAENPNRLSRPSELHQACVPHERNNPIGTRKHFDDKAAVAAFYHQGKRTDIDVQTGKVHNKYCYAWEVEDSDSCNAGMGSRTRAAGQKYHQVSPLKRVSDKVGSKHSSCSRTSKNGSDRRSLEMTNHPLHPDIPFRRSSREILDHHLTEKYAKAGRGSHPEATPAGVDLRRFKNYSPSRTTLPDDHLGGNYDFSTAAGVPSSKTTDSIPKVEGLVGGRKVSGKKIMANENENEMNRNGKIDEDEEHPGASAIRQSAQLYKRMSQKSAISQNPLTKRDEYEFGRAAARIRRSQAAMGVDTTYGDSSANRGCGTVGGTGMMLRYEPQDCLPEQAERYERQKQATLFHERQRRRDFGGEDLPSPIRMSISKEQADRRTEWERVHGVADIHSHYDEARFHHPEILDAKSWRHKIDRGYTYSRGDDVIARDSGRRARSVKQDGDYLAQTEDLVFAHHHNPNSPLQSQRNGLFRQKENMRVARKWVDGGYVDETRQTDEESNDPYFWVERKVRNPHGTTMRPEWLQDPEHKSTGGKSKDRDGGAHRGVHNEAGVYNQSVKKMTGRERDGAAGYEYEYAEDDDVVDQSKLGPYSTAQRERISMHRPHVEDNHGSVHDFDHARSASWRNSQGAGPRGRTGQTQDDDHSSSEQSPSQSQSESRSTSSSVTSTSYAGSSAGQLEASGRAEGKKQVTIGEIEDVRAAPGEDGGQGGQQERRANFRFYPGERGGEGSAERPRVSSLPPGRRGAEVKSRRPPFGAPRGQKNAGQADVVVPRGSGGGREEVYSGGSASTSNKNTSISERTASSTSHDHGQYDHARSRARAVAPGGQKYARPHDTDDVESFFSNAEERIRERDQHLYDRERPLDVASSATEDSVFNRPISGVARSKTEKLRKNQLQTRKMKMNHLKSSAAFVDCLYPPGGRGGAPSSPQMRRKNGGEEYMSKILRREKDNPNLTGTKARRPKFTMSGEEMAQAKVDNAANKQLYKLLQARKNNNAVHVLGGK